MADQFDMIAQQTLASAQPQTPAAGDEFDQVAKQTVAQQAADPFEQVAQQTLQKERAGLQPGEMSAREFAEYQKRPQAGFLASTWTGMKQIPGMIAEDVKRAGQEFADPTKKYSLLKTLGAGAAGAAYDLGMLVNMVVDPATRYAAKIGKSPQEQVEIDRYFVNKAIKEAQLREDIRQGRTSLLDVSKTAEGAGVAPGMAELGTYLLDPSILAGGGARLASAAAVKAPAKTAAAAAARAPRMLATPTLERAGQAVGRVLPSQVAGRATRAAERGVGKAVEVTGRAARGLAETKVGKAIQHIAPVVGYGLGGITGGAGGFFAGGGVGHILGALSKYVVVGKRGGGMLEQMGRAMQEWGNTTAGRSTLSRLQQLQVSETAPGVIRNLAGKLSAADPLLKFAGEARRAAGAGADIMAPAATAQLLQGDREAAGQLVGTGWALGSMGHLATALFTGRAARRMAEDVDIGAWYAGLDPTSRQSIDAMAERTGPQHRDFMRKAMTMEAFVNTLRPEGDVPGLNIEWHTDATWKEATGADPGEAGHFREAAWDAENSRPIVRFNIDRMGQTTLGHEVMHGLGKDPRIVDHGMLNKMLFDQVGPDGQMISKGLFSQAEKTKLGDIYMSKLDPQSEAFRVLEQERMVQPQQFDQRMSEEIAAELFGYWFDKQKGNLLSKLSKPTLRILDSAVSGQGRSGFHKGVKLMADKLGLVQSPEAVQSHVFPGLELTPEIGAFFRQLMRNRMFMGGQRILTNKGLETTDYGPARVGGVEAPTEAVHATWDAKEAESGAEPRLAQIFGDNDIWHRNPDGSIFYDNKNRPRLRSKGELKKIQARRVEGLFGALKSVGLDEAGGMRQDPTSEKDRFIGSYFTDAQIDAIAQLPSDVMPPSLIEKLRTISAAAREGRALDMNYNPALLRNRYSTRLGMTYRVGVPIRLDVTQAGNLLVITYDKIHLDAKMQRWWDADARARDKGKRPAYLAPWDDYTVLVNDLNTYIDNLGQGRPGETGLTVEKRDRLNDLLNITVKEFEGANPIRLSSRRGEKDTIVRSRRFDRINSVVPVPGDPQPIQYERVIRNLQPGIQTAKDLAASAVKATPEPQQAPRSLSEDTGVSPKPPGEAPGTLISPEAARVKQEPAPAAELPAQQISSKATSLEQVPAKKYYDKVVLAKGSRNADIGAGKSELFTEYMGERGVENVRYDRFWQKPEEIAAFVQAVKTPTDTATVNNVLNVIKEAAARDYVVRQAAAVIKPDGTAHFKIHEGDGSGKGKKTTKGYQNNRKAQDYAKEIEQHFSEVTRKGDVLIARKPKAKAIIGQDIMFQPGVKEKITHAALRVPVEDGHNIYTGPQHFVALAKAAKDLGLSSDYFTQNLGDIDGFMTDGGRFVNRADAYRLHFGEEAAKVEAETRGEVMLDSADVPALKARFEKETFRDVLTGDISSAPYVRQQVTERKLAKKQPDTYLPEGGANPMVGGRMKYSPGTVEPWSKKLRADKDAQRVYGKDGVEQIIKSTEATRKIMVKQPHLLGAEVKGVSPMRANADPLFVTTWDMSTVCPQQDLYLASVYHVEERLGRILAPHERYAVGTLLQDMGQQTACWYCYGQIKRDIRDKAISDAAEFNNKLAALGKKRLTVKDVQQFTHRPIEFPVDPKRTTPLQPDSTVKHLPDRKFSRLAAYFLNNPTKLAHIEPSRLRDIIRERVEPTAAEAEFVKTVKNYTMSAVKENLPKGWAPYTDQILTMKQADVDLFNSMAGMRMNSQTDFRPWHVLDLIQGLTHAKMRKLGMHVYTKSPDFINIFGDSGIKFNMSIEYAHDAAGNPMPRGAGEKGYMFNDMEGMPDAQAVAFRKKYPDNAGTMLVAFNPKEVEFAMADPHVDMIIPYHKGGVPKTIEAQIKAVDMSKDQHEHFPKGWGKEMKVYVGAGKTVKSQGMVLTLDDGSKVTIYKDRPITRAEHQNSKERYLEICEKAGITPKFSQWTDHPGYMKLIRDVAREPGKQGAVDPTKIDWDAANEVITRWQEEGGDKIKLTPGMERAINKSLDQGLFQEKVDTIQKNLEVRLAEEKEAKKAAARAKKAGRAD
jgi:hypothetical protein